jgi:16S rRNA (guanine527-N7)-methyltransferase
MSRVFSETIKNDQELFGLQLSELEIQRCQDYYDLVLENNPRLHLVAPCPPKEFALRHILESLTLLEHLPFGTNLTDVGAGAGLPSIPCLLAREDLRATLIESKGKKAAFLDDALKTLGIADRAAVVNKQFAETSPGKGALVTCRALDKFSAKLPQLIKWAGKRRLLFFGGPGIEAVLQKTKYKFVRRLMPMSEQRYLFVIDP